MDKPIELELADFLQWFIDQEYSSVEEEEILGIVEEYLTEQGRT